MDTPTNVEHLPFRRPTKSCNASLHRGEGYCDLPAGAGTDHEGTGRCRLHGDPGDAGLLDEVEELFERLGYGLLIGAAEVMRHSDQERLMEVGNNALVLQRMDLLRRLQDPTLTPREINDLTGSLTRVDALITKHPNGVLSADSPAAKRFATEDDDELARVLKLATGG